MTLETCRKWLLGIWGCGFIVPFTLIIIQSAAGKYGAKYIEVLGWLTSLTLPTVLLMIGVMVANPAGVKSQAKLDEDEKSGADGNVPDGNSKTAHETFVFRITAGVSVFYLVIVSLVFFAEPFLTSKPSEIMGFSKIILAVFDSMISLLIGYFFGKK